VRRAVTWPVDEFLSPESQRIAAVLLDELRHAPREPLHLPLPADRRLARIAQRLVDTPGDTRTLEAWAEWAGVSPRTVNRLFLAETGIGFAQWRRQARLVHALERLAAGEQVANVADALGYATPSNFIAMFRQYFGQSPARYFGRRETSAATSADDV
jgi:AraC-like DNA-binding protein